MSSHPVNLPVKIGGIPLALQALDRWVLWRNVQRTGPNGKKSWTKVPFTGTGAHASSTNQATWCSYADAFDAYLLGDYDGFGIVLGGTLHGIDLDDCRDPDTGDLSELAQETLDKVEGYAEVSPSGTGIKIFTYTNLDGSRTKKEAGVELYKERRYFTVTGHVYKGHNALPEQPQDLGWMFKRFWGEDLGVRGEGISNDRAFELYKSTLEGWGLNRVIDEVLLHLDPDVGYGEWLKIGAALHHQGGGDPEWLEAWDNWSAASGKWIVGYCAEKWDTFSQQRSIGRGAVTLASLLHMTKDKRNLALHSKELTVYNVQQLLAMPQLTWLVKGVIPDCGMGVLFGDSGSGKTFISIDLALAISQGLDWQGCRVKKPTGVLYVSAEGGGGMSKRLKAYSKYHEVDLSDTPMGIVTVGLNLPEGDTDRVIDACARMKERGYPIRFIVMDTLNRTIGGADENSSQDMGKYIGAINRIGNATGAFTLIVHHSGKDASKGARGHSSLRAAVDTEMSIKADGPIQVLTITKSRDGETGKPYAFRREVIQLGLDDDLDPITSCVALPADITLAMSLKPKPQGKWQELVFNVFQDQNSKYTTPELLQAVEVGQPQKSRWRDPCKRAILDLVQKGVLKEVDDILSIA